MADENTILEQVKLDNVALKIKPSMKESRVEKIRLTNGSSSSIGFKVKSTRPTQLGAKPAYGIVKPMSGTYVRVKFKKLSDSAFSASKDRLTILITVLPEGKSFNKPSEVWKAPEGPPKNHKRLPIAIEYDPQVEMSDTKKDDDKKDDDKKDDEKKDEKKEDKKEDEEEEEEGEEGEEGEGSD